MKRLKQAYVEHGRSPVVALQPTSLTVRPGEFIIVPHGTEHMPYTLEETHVILFEPAGTLNTGNVQNERTVADLQRI